MKPARIVSLAIGCLLLLPALALLFGGAILGIGYAAERDDSGYFDVGIDQLATPTVAITAGEVDLQSDPGSPDWVLDSLDTEVRLQVTGTSADKEIFVGIANEADLDAYLAGVAHDEVADLDDNLEATYTLRAGGDVVTPPAEQSFWAASSVGSGTQQLIWEATPGRWSAAIMNADGSPGVATAVNVGLKAGFILPLSLGMLGVGVFLSALAGIMIAVGVRHPDRIPPAPGAVAATHPHPVFSERPQSSPVTLEAELDPELSRGLWLVKWFLAIPHFIALVFMWAMYVVLTLVAAVAILFTGRYPRSIFEFNVGVLRWTWRVSYYATTGGMGSDRYPPFGLSAEPGDHARFDVVYPESQSRGLVLYRWILAIPQLLILGVIAGSVGWSGADGNVDNGISLLGILVLVAGGVLLVTRRYPASLFGLIVGLNRWIFRVVAYVSFMTDVYPPFRLDQGGAEPSTPGPANPPAPSSGTIDLARQHRDLVSR